MTQEVASDLSRTMLNGGQAHKDIRPSGEFIYCSSMYLVAWLTYEWILQNTVEDLQLLKILKK